MTRFYHALSSRLLKKRSHIIHANDQNASIKHPNFHLIFN